MRTPPKPDRHCRNWVCAWRRYESAVWCLNFFANHFPLTPTLAQGRRRILASPLTKQAALVFKHALDHLLGDRKQSGRGQPHSKTFGRLNRRGKSLALWSAVVL